jgi:hypothetical protein
MNDDESVYADMFQKFLSWEKTTHDTIDFKRIYVDMAGDILAGLALSEIMYWHLPNKEGASRMRVKKKGHEWIACPRSDWWNRTRMSPRQVDGALRKLVDAGIILKKAFVFNGAPTTHVRVNYKGFFTLWNSLINSPLENPYITKEANEGAFNQTVKSNLPNGEMEITDSVKTITETTTETTELVSDPRGQTELTDPDPYLDGIPDHIPPHIMRELGFNAKLTSKAEKVRRQQDVEKLINNPVWQAYARGWDGIEPTLYPAQAAAYLRFCNTLQARMDNNEFTLADIEGCTREQLPKPRLGSYLIDYVPVDISDYMQRQRKAKAKAAQTDDNAVPDEWDVDTFVRKPESEAA